MNIRQSVSFVKVSTVTKCDISIHSSSACYNGYMQIGRLCIDLTILGRLPPPSPGFLSW